MLLVAWAALGWLVGGVLELLARRVAQEGPPGCPSCGALEPGPSFSALARVFGPAGPRCRTCGSWGLAWLAGLGPALALTFAVLTLRWPFGRELAVSSLYACILLVVAALDLRHRLVYPVVTIPATLGAMVLTPLALDRPAWSGLAGGLAGAAVFFLFYLLAALWYRKSGTLGLGDVMIAALVGTMTGFPDVWPALLLGTLFGGLGALLVGLVQRSRRAHFAYGPALCLGGLLLLLAGPKP